MMNKRQLYWKTVSDMACVRLFHDDCLLRCQSFDFGMSVIQLGTNYFGSFDPRDCHSVSTYQLTGYMDIAGERFCTSGCFDEYDYGRGRKTGHLGLMPCPASYMSRLVNALMNDFQYAPGIRQDFTKKLFRFRNNMWKELC